MCLLVSTKWDYISEGANQLKYHENIVASIIFYLTETLIL